MQDAAQRNNPAFSFTSLPLYKLSADNSICFITFTSSPIAKPQIPFSANIKTPKDYSETATILKKPVSPKSTSTSNIPAHAIPQFPFNTQKLKLSRMNINEHLTFYLATQPPRSHLRPIGASIAEMLEYSVTGLYYPTTGLYYTHSHYIPKTADLSSSCKHCRRELYGADDGK